MSPPPTFITIMTESPPVDLISLPPARPLRGATVQRGVKRPSLCEGVRCQSAMRCAWR